MKTWNKDILSIHLLHEDKLILISLNPLCKFRIDYWILIIGPFWCYAESDRFISWFLRLNAQMFWVSKQVSFAWKEN